MEGNIRTSGNDIAHPEAGELSVSRSHGQSVYPDISFHISNCCVYCIDDQNLTHNINA